MFAQSSPHDGRLARECERPCAMWHQGHQHEQDLIWLTPHCWQHFCHLRELFPRQTRKANMNIFEPELIAVIKAALTQAAAELRASPSTQAFMAERILQTAATGVSSPEELKSVAIQAGGPAGLELVGYREHSPPP